MLHAPIKKNNNFLKYTCVWIYTHTVSFVKQNLMLRGLCFPLGGWEAVTAAPPDHSVPASSQPSLHRRQLSLMLCLLLVSASGAQTGGEGHGNTRLDVVSVLGPPADFTVRTNLTVHAGEGGSSSGQREIVSMVKKGSCKPQQSTLFCAFLEFMKSGCFPVVLLMLFSPAFFCYCACFHPFQLWRKALHSFLWHVSNRITYFL